MSIIMEALRKASDRPGAVRAPAVPEVSEIPVPEVHDFKFSKSFVMMAFSVLIIAAVAYFTGVSKQGPAVKAGNTAPATAYAGADKVAEGYTPSPSPVETVQEATPISDMMNKLSNPRLTLNGIVYGIGKPAAIIENKIVEEGGSIRGMKVVKIFSDKVEMLDQGTGKSFVLRVD
jgi:hypothetical protein